MVIDTRRILAVIALILALLSVIGPAFPGALLIAVVLLAIAVIV